MCAWRLMGNVGSVCVCVCVCMRAWVRACVRMFQYVSPIIGHLGQMLDSDTQLGVYVVHRQLGVSATICIISPRCTKIRDFN